MVPRVWLPGKCMSAATLVFIGGKLRYFPQGSEFGVHQFSFKNPSPDNVSQSQVLSAKIARYIADMGISPDFLEFSSSVRSDTILLANENNLKVLGVATGGETDVDWTVQARGMIYARGERDSLYGHHKILFGYIKGSGFIFWAVIEAQGREDQMISFELVEIVLNGEEKRIDISDRCARVPSGGIYVNVFVKITETEARAIAYSTSVGVHIRFSSDAPVFLGIAAMTTAGGTEQLETIYNAFSADDLDESLPIAEDRPPPPPAE